MSSTSKTRLAKTNAYRTRHQPESMRFRVLVFSQTETSHQNQIFQLSTSARLIIDVFRSKRSCWYLTSYGAGYQEEKRTAALGRVNAAGVSALGTPGTHDLHVLVP